jgi:hypothetical protein
MIHAYLKCQGKTPLDYQYTLKKMKDRKIKQVFSEDGYSGMKGGIRKWGMRVNMVDAFCIHV